MIVFAHRGASGYAPQNTLPSFRKALELGAEAIELDVQLSADNVPVVIHDFVLNGTTDGTGFVHRQTWKELQKADAGSWFAPEFAGTGIPSLEEVLELIPRDVLLNVEIKSISSLDEPTARVIADLLNQDKQRNLAVSSFNHPLLKEFRELAPDIPLGVLMGDALINPVAYAETAELTPYSLNPEATYLTPELTAVAHEKGWKVFCYTVNTTEQARMIQAMGADGIFSDYPDLPA